jgi:hypothetical protein
MNGGQELGGGEKNEKKELSKFSHGSHAAVGHPENSRSGSPG